MPSYSDNYQIKLISTGEEGGTWGDSTNQNLKKIEQALGTREVIIVNTYVGGGSSYTSNTLTWLTDDDANSYAAGSEGRARVFEFQYSGTASAAQKVVVCGNTDADDVDRVFFVYNNIGGDSPGQDLILDSGGGTYTLKDQSYAAVYTSASPAAVGNLLSRLQIEDLVFPAVAEINVLDGNSAALKIKSDTRDFITFDSNSSGGRVLLDAALKSLTNLVLEGSTKITIASSIVDLETQAVDFQLADAEAASLKFTDGGVSLLTFDTTDGAAQVEISDLEVAGAMSIANLTSTGTLTVNDLDSPAVSDWQLKEDTALALRFKEASSGDPHLVISTDSGGTVAIPVKLNVTGTSVLTGAVTAGTTLAVTSTSTFGGISTFNANIESPGYINFDSTDGSTGFGIRNNSGVVETKNDADDNWGSVYSSELKSGEGLYYQSPEQTLTTDQFVDNLAHSLGVVPRLLTATLKCTNPGGDQGYSQNDEVAWGWSGVTADSRGLVYGADATNCFFATNDNSPDPLRIIGKAATGSKTIDIEHWKLIIRAWK